MRSLTALAIDAFAHLWAVSNVGEIMRPGLAWLLGSIRLAAGTGWGGSAKAGQADIRRLLMIGAMTRLNWLGRKSILPGSWLERMLEREPRMLVAIALANKMAPAIWAMMTKSEDYGVPAQAAVA